MADPAFFKKSQNFTLDEIVQISGCEVLGRYNSSFKLSDVSPLSTAGPSDVSFLDNIKYKNEFLKTKAGACFVSSQMAELAPEGLICLVSQAPYKAYALVAQAFYPEVKPADNISASATIDPSAVIGDGVTIGAGVYIGANVKIGSHAWIEPNVVIQDGVQMGNYCRIGANSSVSHAILHDYVRLYPGVCVGQDGFGFAIDPTGHVKVPQLGRVIIHDHVQVGSGTTIDRGAGPDTVIGQGTWIDNLVQIGHNVVIGRGCVIVAQVGISGSATLGDYVVIGGQAGLAGHLKIGSGVRIGAQSGVMADISSGQEYLGSPAFPKTQYFRQVAALNRLIKRKKDV